MIIQNIRLLLQSKLSASKLSYPISQSLSRLLLL